MRNLSLFAAVLILGCLMTLNLMGAPFQSLPAKNTDIVPCQDVALAEITITDDLDHTVDLSSLGFSATILLVRTDGNFLEGSTTPNQSNDPWRDSGSLQQIPVSGRSTWHFKRQIGAGTIHIWQKALGSN